MLIALATPEEKASRSLTKATVYTSLLQREKVPNECEADEVYLYQIVLYSMFAAVGGRALSFVILAYTPHPPLTRSPFSRRRRL